MGIGCGWISTLVVAVSCVGYMIQCIISGDTFIDVIWSTPLLFLSLTFTYLRYHRTFSGFTVFTFIKHLRQITSILYHGRRLDTILTKSWKDASCVQRKLLEMILQRNAVTEYIQDNALGTIDTVEMFRSNYPISKYERYRQYAEGADSKSDVMFPGKPKYFASTSGTTGTSTIHPKSQHYIDAIENYMYILPFYYVYRQYPACILKKVVSMDVYCKCHVMPSGLEKGPAGQLIMNHTAAHTVPAEAYYMTNTQASVYVNLLFSMAERNVGIITSLFSGSMFRFFQAMEEQWEMICDDIERGHIQSGYSIPLKTLNKLRSEFRADPARANELRAQFQQDSNLDIAKRIWPGLSIAVVITSGTFKHAANICSKTYLRNVPYYSKAHGATEGMYGINRYQETIDPIYCLISPINFYELLPLNGDGSTTILPSEAELGERYELVVTTPEGLYRYRTTDVIEAMDMRGEALTYRYSQRIGDYLCVHQERTPVRVIEEVIISLLSQTQPEELLRDFTCSLSAHVNATLDNTNVASLLQDDCRYIQRYWVFVEINSVNLLPDNFKDQFEQRLCTSDDMYSDLRSRDLVGAAEIVQVRLGTFYHLRRDISTDNEMLSYNQFKTPRVMQNERYLRTLLTNTVGVDP